MATVKGIWVFNKIPYYSSALTVSVSFTSNGENFSAIQTIEGDDSGNGTVLRDFASWVKYTYADDGIQTVAYNGSSSHQTWTNDSYRIIDFGETEQTVDDAFLTWLSDNAVQTPTADLTNTTWNIPAGWTAEAGYGIYSVDCNNGAVGGNQFCIGYYDEKGMGDPSATANKAGIFADGFPVYTPSNTVSFTVTFTDGTDVTNPSLIWWLATNGEIQVTIPAGTYVCDGYPSGVSFEQPITFKSNGETFTSMAVSDSFMGYGSTNVFDYSWTDDAYKTIIIETDQTVPADFATWFNDNYTLQASEPEETTPTVTLTYNGKTYTLTAGQKATFACEGKVMLDDITAVVSGESEDTMAIKLNITYNGTTTAVEAGQTATLACSGKKMRSDLVFEVVEVADEVTVTIQDSSDIHYGDYVVPTGSTAEALTQYDEFSIDANDILCYNGVELRYETDDNLVFAGETVAENIVMYFPHPSGGIN